MASSLMPWSSMSVAARSGLGSASGDVNAGGALNGAPNSSAPGIGASSLAMDVKSSLSAGPPHPQLKQGASSVTSPSAPDGRINAIKKPRIDVMQEDILHKQMIQQLLQGQDQSPQLQALIQQQRLQLHQQQQKQQILQSIPQIQHAQIIQQQQKQQQLIGLGKRPIDSGICSRRIMQYLYHQRHRPAVSWLFCWAASIRPLWYVEEDSDLLSSRCRIIRYFIGGSLLPNILRQEQGKGGACHYMMI